ncbi:uncharacterized protein PRCAT00005559001 [Priceomyces carsonii]|uniref:uncharacterized protein n=1 Tax=Priceomyces carsonii TaxID=28549 RepID=UPI002EDB1C6F|nr:unnamed protein product [Priceomyces carsonii]
MQQRSIALLQRIDSDIEQILLKFQDIFEVGIIRDKSKELLSVDSLTINSDALTIIRLCEDLLNITRGLKELWCLGSMKVKGYDIKSQDEDVEKVFNQFNQLTEKIGEFEDKDS